jgi:hypothetical protein
MTYVSNGSIATGPSVSVCNVASDGTLTGCTLTSANIGDPEELAVNGDTLYVANGSGPGVTYCTILADGSLSNCTVSNGGASYNLPTQITIY